MLRGGAAITISVTGQNLGSLMVLGTTHWTAVGVSTGLPTIGYSLVSLGNFDKLPSLIHENLSVPIMQLHVLNTKSKLTP